jgi:hypothetical protein
LSAALKICDLTSHPSEEAIYVHHRWRLSAMAASPAPVAEADPLNAPLAAPERHYASACAAARPIVLH